MMKHAVVVVSTLIGLISGSSFAQPTSRPTILPGNDGTVKTLPAAPQTTAYDHMVSDCIKQRAKAASEVEKANAGGRERLAIAFTYSTAIDKACIQGLLAVARSVESKPQLAARQTLESVEHQLARERYDRIAPLCREDEKTQKENHAQLELLSSAKPESWQNLVRMDFLLENDRMYDLVTRECHDALEEAGLQVEQVDACLKVYNQTADKKTSDLTNREIGRINECKSLNLYPPQAKPK